jgi:SAM-dependent MidA family methyltransferase
VSLRQKIVQEIRERGPIPFSQYMEMCLYDPESGYYSRNVEQFGKAGDFYTSSDVHAVFGRLLARQFDEMWRALGSPEQIEILELGPGRGLFARDVLDWSEKKFPAFFEALRYSLSERSPALRERLKTTLDRHLAARKAELTTMPESAPEGQNSTAHGVSRGSGVPKEQAPEGRKSLSLLAEPGEGTASTPPEDLRNLRALAPAVPLIVFANEFFDALPVEVLSPKGELRITEKDDRFLETWVPGSAENLAYLDRYSVPPAEGERVETARIAHRYMSRLAASIERGFIVAIDYGYTRAEQLAGRHRGTVSAYRQHSVSDNPYQSPGEQDITAHLNFTALAAAAEQRGMQVQPLLTQSQFLMGIGEPNQFADAFEDCRVPQEQAKVALQLKHLVTPAGLGETFHVLVASTGVAAETVANLSGLSFGKQNKR